MSKAVVSIGRDHYKMQAVSGGGHLLIADEPLAVGGTHLGFSPDELLCAALGACTSATLRMYADRKEWNLESVQVEVSLERQSEAGGGTHFIRNITLKGDLSEDQRERLIDIAQKCPVHKTLSGPLHIDTNLL